MPSFSEHRRTLEAWARLPALERVEPSGRAALTFDDGPDEEGTPAVLDALDAAGARATFFLVGEQLMGRAGLGREITTRGHEIALHGFAHLHHAQLSPREVKDDLARGLGAVEAATGRRPRFFRPPYGEFTEVSLEACHALGLEPVLWSAWGLDWEQIPAERIAELVTRDLDDGAVILLHDAARYAPRPSAVPTADAVPVVARAARAAGLELVPLGAAVTSAPASDPPPNT